MCNTENESPFILKSIKIDKNLALLIKWGKRETMAYLSVSGMKAGYHVDSTQTLKNNK